MALRKLHFCCEILGVSILGFLLLAGTVTWFLSKGPVRLDFLSTHIEQAVNSAKGPIRVKVGGTHLAWAGWERTLDIRVKDVRALAENDRVIARVPEMSVTFSLRALLRGIFAPTSFDIIAPRVRLIRNPTGEMALMVEEHAAEDAGLLAALVGALGVENDPARPISYLRRLSILNARVSVDDRLTGIVWTAPEVNLVLLREQGEIRGTLFGALNVGGAPVRIDASAAWKPGEETVDLSIGLEPMRIARLASLSPAFKAAEGLEISVSGRASVLLGVDGTLYDGSFELRGEDGKIVAPSLWKGGVPVSEVTIAGRFNSDPGLLEIEKFSADLGGPKIGVSGRLLLLGETASIDGTVKVDRMPLDALPEYWPEGFALKARTWILGNMSQGIVEDTAATVAVRIPDIAKPEIVLESLSGRMRLRDTTINYLTGLPKLKKISGTAIFWQDRFVASVSRAEAGGLTVEKGTVSLIGLNNDQETAVIDASIVGSLSQSLALIDHKPLGFARKFGVDPAKVAGSSRTRLKLKMPMRVDLKTEQIEIAATAQISDADLPSFVFGQSVERGDFNLKVDTRGLTLEGTARVAGIPAKMKWLERFGPKARIVRQYEATGIIRDADFKRFGMEAMTPYVRGELALDVAYLQPRKGAAEMVVKAGLKQSSLYLPGLDWRKPSGEDGLAWLSLNIVKGGAVRVRDFDLQTRELRARGSADFSVADGLKGLDLRSFKLGRTQLGATVALNDKGEYDIALKGDVLDATPFFARTVKRGEATTLPPLRLNADLGRVWLDPEIPVDGLRAELIHNGTEWIVADAKGALGKDRSLVFAMAAGKDNRDIRLTSDNAGAALRALDFIDTFQEGRLVLAARQPKGDDKAPWTGSLDITAFSLVEAPILARVLTLASFTGIGNTLAGKGIYFDTLNVPFTFRDGTFAFRNARSVGSELGFTANGTVDTREKTVAVDGTIIPAYTINSALGRIPIVGQIFSGTKGSGVFAATYTVTGSLDKPDVRVNPLAALAPGFLRNLLGIFDSPAPNATDQPAEAPVQRPSTGKKTN